MIRDYIKQTQSYSPCKNESGIYLLLVALLLTTLFAIVGVAVDGGRLYVLGLDQQRAADAAALAGGREIGNLSNSEVEDLARQVAEDNFAQNRIKYDSGNLGDHFTINFIPGLRELQVTTSALNPSFIFGAIVPGKTEYEVRAAAAATRRNIAVVLVIDNTGSMSANVRDDDGTLLGTKLDLTKAAARNFINQFNTQDRIGIVSYALNSRVDYHIENPYVPADAAAAITNIPQTRWATNIQIGLLEGLREMLKLNRNIWTERYIVLMTDGTPNQNVPDNGGTTDTGTARDLLDTLYNDQTMPYPDFPNSSQCTGGNAIKQNFVHAMLAADYIRQAGITLLTVSIGDLEDTMSPQEPWGTSSPWGSGSIRPNFMRWLANDRVSADDHGDVSFPNICVPSYQDNEDNEYSNGLGLISPDPRDIDSMFQQTANYIALRLTS